MTTLETILVALVVAGAAAYVTRYAWRKLHPSGGGGCGCGCSSTPGSSKPRRTTLTISGKAVR